MSTFLPQPLGFCALSPLFTHHAVPIILTTSTILPTFSSPRPPLRPRTHTYAEPSIHLFSLLYKNTVRGKELFFGGTQEPPLRAQSSFHNQKLPPGE